MERPVPPHVASGRVVLLSGRGWHTAEWNYPVMCSQLRTLHYVINGHMVFEFRSPAELATRTYESYIPARASMDRTYCDYSNNPCHNVPKDDLFHSGYRQCNCGMRTLGNTAFVCHYNQLYLGRPSVLDLRRPDPGDSRMFLRHRNEMS